MTKLCGRKEYVLQMFLVKYFMEGGKTKTKNLQSVVVFKVRPRILATSHNYKTAGHLGVKKTLNEIR